MKQLDIMKQTEPYISKYDDSVFEAQEKAADLCWDYHQITPSNHKQKAKVLKKLLGTYHPDVRIESGFQCDYGFNIHTKGLALINYNCVILDTSPVHIGKNVFIGPGTCLTCAGHVLSARQREEGIETSQPITIGNDVWIGPNVTICGGVTIGDGSVIAAGSVVTQDIPVSVLALGTPCRVERRITAADRIKQSDILTNLKE